MALFYFDVNDGRQRTVDDTGVELSGFSEARAAAVREIALIIRDDMPDGERESYVVTVRDACGVPIYVATATMLGEALERPG